jgi:hypothetical protein
MEHESPAARREIADMESQLRASPPGSSRLVPGAAVLVGGTAAAGSGPRVGSRCRCREGSGTPEGGWGSGCAITGVAAVDFQIVGADGDCHAWSAARNSGNSPHAPVTCLGCRS